VTRRSPRVVLFDYGSGNIRSAERALVRAGADVTVTTEFGAAMEADGLVVPGVGAFAACMQGLVASQGDRIVDSRVAGGRPVLAICVGHQVLFERGVEHGVHTSGIGEWPGSVDELRAGVLPHIGWNTVSVAESSAMFAGVESERFYFVHSYAARSWDLVPLPQARAPLVSWSTHERDRFVAAVEDKALWATQFHPEKSGDAGAKLLSNWVQSI
jgi:imidazole glycerol-phosphate synthase subunit HisH